MIFSYHAVPTEEEMFFIGRPHSRVSYFFGSLISFVHPKGN